MEALRHVEVWRGTYKDIAFEINKFAAPLGGDGWTYYLYLPLASFVDSEQAETWWLKGEPFSPTSPMVRYDYFNHATMQALDWHGGMTWYSKEGELDGAPRVVKLGCDYQHLWDEGQRYSLENVAADARHTIDTLCQLVPLKKRCNWNGGWYLPTEGEQGERGWTSHEGIAARASMLKKTAAA